MRSILSSLFFLLAVLSSSGLAAQQTLYQYTGATNTLYTGNSLAGLGDVNNDGTPDFAIGIPGDDSGGTNAGKVSIYSGATGNVLFDIQGTATWQRLGFRMAAIGDITGDNITDLAVSGEYDNQNFYPTGIVEVFSGADGTLLYTYTHPVNWSQFGDTVAAAGDVNNDSVPDFMIGAPYNNLHGTGSGSAWVYSGADGSVLHTYHGDDPWDLLGSSLSTAGDIDGDGFDDFAIGIRQADFLQRTDAGIARIYSGRTGGILREYPGRNKFDRHGTAVANLGDVDYDGVPDIVVGAVDDLSDNLTRPGYIRVYSNATGDVLLTLEHDFNTEAFGAVLLGPGDMDGDGAGEIIVGAPKGGTVNGGGIGSGAVRIYSGRTFERFFYQEGAAAGAELGTALAAVGDVDQDGLADFMMAQPEYSILKGRAELLTADSLTLLSVSNLVAGQNATFQTSGGAANTTVTFLYSLAGFGNSTLPGGLQLEINSPYFEMGSSQSNGTGVATLNAAVPSGTSGISVYFQAYEQRVPGPWAATSPRFGLID